MAKELRYHEIDGVTYKEVDRKAEVGEKVVVVHAKHTHAIKPHRIGEIFTVKEAEGDTCGGMIRSHVVVTDFDGYGVALYHDQYRVLEPVAGDSSPESIYDIVANITRRVHELESEMKEALAGVRVTDDSVKWAHSRINTQQDFRKVLTGKLERLETKLTQVDAKAEMALDDIVTLDERTIGATVSDLAKKATDHIAANGRKISNVEFSEYGDESTAMTVYFERSERR